MSPNKRILILVSLVILAINISATADWKEDARAIDISGGENHTLVLTQNKWPWACGSNVSYQLGIGDDANDQWTLVRVHGPNDVNFLENINDIDAGWTHSLALDVNGFVWAWGRNVEGQLGDNQKSSTQQSATPVQVHDGGMNTPSGYLENIIVISAGRSGLHSLAVDANNFVWAWGYNYNGQLGNGESGIWTNKPAPVKVRGGEMGTTFLENIIAVSAGENQSMALDVNGFVWTWGSNHWPADYGDYPGGTGKLGNGLTEDTNTPVQVLKGQQQSSSDYLENIVAVNAGWDHCMALEKYDPCLPWEPNYDPNYGLGYVYTWGNNGQCYDSDGGRLGNGTMTNSNTPVFVLSGQQDPNNPDSYLKGIIAVSAGEGHSLALDLNGTVWAWGDNKYGQLGNDTNDPCTTAVAVVGLNGEGYLENIIAISAGFWHSLAIDVDGTIWTWGKGDYGRLGLGNDANSNTPHPIRVVYNFTQHTFYFGIQTAIDNANNGEVIVASLGTYYENIDFLDKSITVRSTDPDNWDVVAKTIIDGSNNDSNVVTFDDNSGSTLAGFTITNGYDGGIYFRNQSSADITNCEILNNDGSGIYCWDNSDPNIINCNIEANNDGGIWCDNSHPNITNCIFSGNSASHAGGIYNAYSDPNVTNCTFTGNTADGGYGGGMLNYQSSPTVTNCIFSGNSAEWGGGMQNLTESSPTVINCSFSGNSAGYGGGMHNEQSSPTITNCIFWDNDAVRDGNEIYNWGDSDPNFSYCDIEDSNGSGDNWHLKLGIDGGENIDEDPLFYDPNDPNDYHLGPNSPCIDAGTNTPIGGLPTTDIDGEDRVIDGDGDGNSIVDMGADEYDYRDADFNNDGTVNFIDYAIFANAWQTDNPDFSLDDDNDVDMNDLSLFVEDWLWIAGWTKTFAAGYGQSMSQGFGLMEALYQAAPAEQQPTQIKPLDIKEIIKRLEEIWLDPEVQEVIDEDKWLKFMKSLKRNKYKIG